MIPTRLRAGTVTLLVAVTVLVAAVMNPTANLITEARRRLREEDGEIVQNILWVAGFAAIAIAVIAVIRTFVINEAQNLPTSGS